MAVLWEQRKMVRALDELSQEKLREFSIEAKTGESSLATQLAHMGMGQNSTEENILISKMLKDAGKSSLDTDLVIKLKRILDTCIRPSGFVDAVENPDFSPFSIPDIYNNMDLKTSSSRLISVNADKGSEILNWWYFIFKYLARELPPLVNIGISIITALLTSGAIWLFLFEILGFKISK